MLKMRLQRIGRKNDPSYRVVVTDSRNGPRTGNHVDLLGSYNPKMKRFQIDGEKAKHWISKGVQTSDTLHNLLVSEKIIDGKKKNVLPKKSPIVSEEKLKAEADAKVVAEKPEADTVKEEVTPAEGEPVADVVEETVPVEEPAADEATPAEESVEKEKNTAEAVTVAEVPASEPATEEKIEKTEEDDTEKKA